MFFLLFPLLLHGPKRPKNGAVIRISHDPCRRHFCRKSGIGEKATGRTYFLLLSAASGFPEVSCVALLIHDSAGLYVTSNVSPISGFLVGIIMAATFHKYHIKLQF